MKPSIVGPGVGSGAGPWWIALLALPLLLAACKGSKSRDAGDDILFTAVTHNGMPSPTKGAGGLLKPLRLVTVVAANDDLRDQLLSFGDSLVKSQWWAAIAAEYGLGTPDPSPVKIVGPEIHNNPDGPEMASYLQTAIDSADTPPTPDGRTLYLLFLPHGSGFYYHGEVNATCTGVWGGYHTKFGTLGDALAPIMRCNPLHGQSLLDELTMVASRLVAEAATDSDGTGWRLALKQGDAPPAGSIWANAENTGFMEIGGLCGPDLNEPGTTTRIVEGGVAYQRIFSGTAAMANGDPCIPSLPIPYYSLTTDAEWYPGQPNQAITVPLTGWSTDATGSWLVRQTSTWVVDLGKKPTTLLNSPTSTTIANVSYKTLNNGDTMMLTVNIPATAQPGYWAMIALRSFRLDDSGNTPAGEDFGHRWLVGVTVP